MSTTPKEGLYAIVSIGAAGTLALLTGVDLSWTQDSRRFYPMGSLIPSAVLKGVLSYDGNARRAFTSTNLMGTFALGTWSAVGTILPRGGTNPYIAGTFYFTGGALSNMAAESIAPTEESVTFMLVNPTFQD